ncbi:MAG: ORF6C domain-containing protein [Culicoidibacterales bacterium]
MELTNLQNGTITTLELVEQINLFRKQYDEKTELGHNDLLKIVRDEFEEEIGLGEISQTHYTHPQNKQQYPMYELTPSQAKQVLVRESKSVRKAVIAYVEKLEAKVKQEIPTSPMDFIRVMFEAVEKQDQQVKQIVSDVEFLKSEVKITSQQASALGQLVGRKVHESMKKHDFFGSRQNKRMLFKEINSDIKKYAKVYARCEIKASQFDDVYAFILDWEPSYLIIKQLEWK